MAIPIWKDKIVTLGAADALFGVYDWDVTASYLYKGRAVAKPGETYAKVRVNDICADFIVKAFPTITDRTFTSLSLLRLGIIENTGGSWTPVTDVTFFNDWSYDDIFTPNTESVLSRPITTRVDARMYLLITKLHTGTVNATYKNTSGTSSIRTTTISGTKDGTCCFKVNAIANPASVQVAGFTFKVVTNCAKYALYYMNAYGGWDQLLIEGNTTESDSQEKHDIDVEYDNTNIRNRGKVNFVNEVTKTWTFNTGLLTDDEASRMHHLLESPLVYLMDIPAGKFIPVVMDTTSFDVKTYKNQGNRLFNYQFSASLAQDRFRR